jgi:hypothetical protein
VAAAAPSSLTFGNHDVGTTSASQPVTLSNQGTGTLVIAKIAATTNFGESDNCNGSIAPAAFCTINVTFSPTTAGPLNGTLNITDNSNGVAGSTQIVSLMGTGAVLRQAAPPTFSIPPGTYNSVQTVAISDATAGATIFYTTNGTAPTTSSAQYTGALKVNATETIEAIATASGYSTSHVAAATYIIALSQTITFGALPNKVLGSPPFSVSATASSGLTVSFASMTTPVCTVSGSTVTLVAVGVCTVQATQAGNATYAAAAPVNQSFQVTAVVQPAGNLYSISETVDSGLRHQLSEINPANGAFVQQFSVSLPGEAGTYYSVGGMASGNGRLWAISAAAEFPSDQHQLWAINPANGALVQQFLVSLPGEGFTYYNVGGLAFGNGSLWAISASVDSNNQHPLWEINPANGAFVHQFLVSLPGEGFNYYSVGGLAFANGSLWAIGASVDNTYRHQLSEINPANGAFVRQFWVSIPGEGGTYFSVGGLAYGNGSLWAISATVDNTYRHQLSEIDPASGAFVRQFWVSIPGEGGVYYNVVGLAFQ